MIQINDNQIRDWRWLEPNGYLRVPPAVGIGEPTVPVEIPRRQILLGDATEQLRTLPSASIDCVVTSPPYYQLRDYAADGQIGLEPTVEDWVASLRPVFAEVARVLKPAGSIWLNLGDAYSRNARYGAPSKGMFCAPERLLLALADDGWIVRGKVIWSKTNSMPNSVADRLSQNYEVIYFLTRSPRYFFNLDAIRDAVRVESGSKVDGPVLGKNPGDIWRIATKGFRGAHFATFPPELIRKPILASCPEAICTQCGTPWKRAVNSWRVSVDNGPKHPRPKDQYVMRFGERWNTLRQIGELVPCGCNASTVPGIVLDPFFGAGTVGVVAEELGRGWGLNSARSSARLPTPASIRQGQSDDLNACH